MNKSNVSIYIQQVILAVHQGMGRTRIPGTFAHKIISFWALMENINWTVKRVLNSCRSNYWFVYAWNQLLMGLEKGSGVSLPSKFNYGFSQSPGGKLHALTAFTQDFQFLLRFSSSDGCERVDELWMFRWAYISETYTQNIHNIFTLSHASEDENRTRNRSKNCKCINSSACWAYNVWWA